MSAPKRTTWRTGKVKPHFYRAVFIPDEVIPDGKQHSFTDRGEECAYIAGHDDNGAAFLTIIRTFRPPVRKPKPQLRYIQGGKPELQE